MADTGIGISRDRRETIFERFTQEDSSTIRRFGGTGLGLAISKFFVEKMGGRIWVESEMGEGSVFFFTIALKEVAEPEEIETLDDVDGEDWLSEKASGIRVLLVDDDKVNLKLGKINLETIGFTVDYGMIFMDVQMPVMDGYEAAEKIRRAEAKTTGETTTNTTGETTTNTSGETATNTTGETATNTAGAKGSGTAPVPILTLTASTLVDEIEKCYKAGMNDFISKPIDRNRVLSTVKKYF